MTTPFLSYAFPATGATSSRTLPDHLADFINVKDYGAVGDGSTDDTAAIQAAFDAAWGPAGSPHARNSTLNKPVIFPAGTYKVTDTIYVESVAGGQIIGAGSKTTSLVYMGAIPNVVPASYSKTSLFFTNGFASCRIEGISFIMTGGNAQIHNTVCFNWNWNQVTTPAINTTQLLFIDVGFAGGTYGCLVADDENAPYWGYECDVGLWINCWIDNCLFGLKTQEFNAINAAFLGGSVTNCSQTGGIGMWFRASGIGTIAGTYFANNDLDIQLLGGTPTTVIGCYSTSPNFAKTGERSALVGCEHNGSSIGYFAATTPGWGATIDSCRSLNGILAGRGDFFISETQFGNSGWAGTTGSKIHELVTASPLTFAMLPPAAETAEGLIVSISDSPTAMWGASVTTGGGGTPALVRWNGANWTVVGI